MEWLLLPCPLDIEALPPINAQDIKNENISHKKVFFTNLLYGWKDEYLVGTFRDNNPIVKSNLALMFYACHVAPSSHKP